MKGRIRNAVGWTLAIVAMGLLVAGSAMAGGAVNKQNYSTDYLRTLSRNAATDYADIAAYNPAGIMQMEQGLYAKLDAHYISKKYSNTVPGFGKMEQDEPSIIPGLFTIYKQPRWAAFFAFTTPAGGGTVDYDQGNARTVALATGVMGAYNRGLAQNPLVTPDMYYNRIDPGQLKAQSVTMGFTLGGSFALTDSLSLAAGARVASGKREFEGHAGISAANYVAGVNDPVRAGIKLEETATGVAGVLGVNFAPTDRLNFGFTFISNTKMEYEVKVDYDTLGITPQMGLAHGSKRRIDIPASLAFGASYRFLPELKVDLSYTYYMETAAKIDTLEGEGNSWDLGVSAEYTFNPKWKASVGYMYTHIHLEDDQQFANPEEPLLDANSVAAGVVFSPLPSLAINLGGMLVMYDKVTDHRGIEYEKSIVSAGLGIQYRFF